MGPVLLAVIGLVAATLLLLLLLVVRRVLLARQERRHTEAATRMRPVAIAFIGADEPLPDDLSPYDQIVLAEQLRRYSQTLSGEAAERIASYFRASEALQRALAGLRARRSWRRADAAFALGDMAVAETTPELLRALGDRKRIVRTAAVRGLGRLQAKEATEPMVRALVEHTVPRGVAGNALLRMGPVIVPELRELATTPEPEMQAVAVTLLGLLGSSRDADVVGEALHDSSADVRVAAAEALGRIGTPKSEPELEAALDDRARYVRAAAATSLGEIGSPSVLDRLLDLARTDEFRPARAAARAAALLDAGVLSAAAADRDAGPHIHEAADRLALRAG
jgi:HEAT repeat protein